jgi:hypothetical protein
LPSPKSPLRAFVDALGVTAPLRPYARSIFLGARALSGNAAPPRIVIIPIEGPIGSAQNNITSIRDVSLELAVRIWGNEVDETWDLKTRLFQALEAQSVAIWKSLSETWDIDSSASRKGEEVEVRITAWLSIDRRPQTLGEVDAYGIAPDVSNEKL